MLSNGVMNELTLQRGSSSWSLGGRKQAGSKASSSPRPPFPLNHHLPRYHVREQRSSVFQYTPCTCFTQSSSTRPASSSSDLAIPNTPSSVANDSRPTARLPSQID
jgi:hypothetical protein